jgi:AcrR family transcriptional regulator
MPKVSPEHLAARRQQIVDAARARFASHGFAGTSMTDLVEESGLSIGAIYRYFSSKDEIVAAICEHSNTNFPTELTPEAIHRFLEHVRAMARDHGHARLVAQIYAEAAISPALGVLVAQQLSALRTTVIDLLPHSNRSEAARIAEGVVAVSVGYNQQLAVRGDLDPAPFAAALISILDGQTRAHS